MEQQKILEGYTVVELASILAAPLCGSFLAELGAQVIKVENKLSGGDMTRRWKITGESSKAPISAYYASANMGKDIVQLNLSDESGREVLNSYLERADIVLCNLKESAKARFKLTFEDLQKFNPSLILGEVIGYPNSDRPAFDAVLQAETGFMSINGEPRNPPLKMPLALMDILCAHQLKEGILAAIIKQSRNKKAVKVTVSLYEAAIGALANQASNYLMTGQVPKAIGSAHPNIAPYGEVYYDAQKQPFILAVGSNTQFSKLVEVIGLNEELTKRWRTNDRRLAERKELQDALQNRFDHMNINAILEKLEEKGVPAGEIKTIDQVFENSDAKNLILSENQEGVLKKALKQAVFRLNSPTSN